jgi:hypothetical protein
LSVASFWFCQYFNALKPSMGFLLDQKNSTKTRRKSFHEIIMK